MDHAMDFDAGDIAAITKAALDYGEGWYIGNPDRMRRALHPGLMKRTVVPDPYRGSMDIREPPTTAEQMMRWTAEGAGTAWQGDVKCDVQVLDVFRDIATARCQSPEYVDYLRMARFGDAGWRIVNVLWQLLEGKDDPAANAAEKWAFWHPKDENNL